ncbi:MAG: anthranilate synthase component I [Alphaproteobacteria bacterium]
MRIQPEIEPFTSTYDLGRPQVVWTRTIADLETPVSAMLKLTAGKANNFLLESVEGGTVRGRYSIIGLDPDVIWRATGNAAQINTDAANNADNFVDCEAPTLDALRELLAQSQIDLPEELPPMAAGVFGYMGYDTVRLIEDLPSDQTDILSMDDALFLRPTIIAVFDAVKDEITIITPVRPVAGTGAASAYNRAVDRITATLDALNTPLATPAPMADLATLPEPVSNMTPAQYGAMVDKAKAYIEAGDIFQVVLSQRFEMEFSLPPFALYRALRRVNPSPFLYYLNFGTSAVIGSSPEILVRVRGGRVTIRPIAGTRPRGATPAQDRVNAKSLLDDPKERAEHLMLLDLGRNDIGRVGKIGTVEVTDRFFLEYYSHVMHIVSNVEADLDPQFDAIDALAAGFPAGTVSGAPKVRAMQIIDELESDKRGVYAGCVGYFSANGDMDTCIVLRTAVVKDGKIHVQAGAGIVADSVPENEQAECIAKAKALFLAAQEAVHNAATLERGQ